MTRKFWPFRTRAALVAQRDWAEARTAAVQLRLARLKQDRDKADVMAAELLFERKRLLEQRADLQSQVGDLKAQLAAVEGHRNRLQEEADDNTHAIELLHNRLDDKAKELQCLLRLMDQAEHGDGEMTVLLHDGAAISVHRTKDGATQAAHRTYGVDPEGWTFGQRGRPLTEGWVMSTVPLVGVQAKAVTA